MSIPCFAGWHKVIQELTAVAANDGLPPVSIAVCDPAGHLIIFVRMDGAPLRSIAIAQCKAYTSARMGTTTAAFLDRLRNENIELSFFCDPQLTPLPGGVPIHTETGLIGSIGVSGRKPADDQGLADYSVVLARELMLQKI